MSFDFEQRLAFAETPPSRVYRDPQILEKEEARIFRRTPQLVGRLDQVSEPGSFFTADVSGQSLLILRDQNGELRGFHNVCRHRAGPIATESGKCKVLQCRYHGWTYSLNGKLLGTPDFDGVENFDRERVSLVPVKLEVWEQFIFAQLEGDASLTEFLDDIPAKTSHVDISAMKFVHRKDYLVECNWKVYVDNYVEGYHIPIVHPSLMQELDYEHYRTVTRRFYSLQDAPIRGGDGENRRYQPSDAQSEALYFWIFPNLMLNIYPDNLSTNLILPLGTDRTLTRFDWYFHDPDSPGVSETISSTIRLSDEIQEEDIKICEAVQRGLRSPTYDRGRYSVKRENGLHHFHSLWYEFLSAGGDIQL